MDSVTNTEFQSLTAKQRAFVIAYCEKRNATEAARIAGYTGTKKVIAQSGFENLKKPVIIKAMDAYMRPKLAQVGVTTERTLRHISEIAYAPWNDYIHVDGLGNVHMNLNHKLQALFKLVDIDPNLQRAEHDPALQPHLHFHYDPNMTPEESRRALFNFLRRRDT